MLRPIFAVLTAFTLLVAACGDDDDPGLDPEAQQEELNSQPLPGCDGSVEGVSVLGDQGMPPVVEVDSPLSVEETTCELLIEGEGRAAEEDDTVVFEFVFANGRTGEITGSSYDSSESATVVLNTELLRGVRAGLTGARAGARVVVAIAPIDAYQLQDGDPAQGLEADDTLVFVADVLDVRQPLDRAEGTAVEPTPGLPTVELAENGSPTISVPEADPPAELVAQPLIEGAGAAVEPEQTIIVHYTGVIWGSGEVFDTSWDSSPTTFPIGTGSVIAGWDKGLVGRTIGSQVLLVIPPADGYGEEGAPSAGIGPTDTLVFVVDILDAR